MTGSSRRRVAILGLVAVGVLGACTSRTLPLPPPSIDSVEPPNAQGLVRVRGTAQEGAAVGVINEGTSTGVVVTSDASGCERTCPFEAEVAAEPGDALRIWQFFETGSSTEEVVPD